ncbi:MAG: hypothetical protein P8K77_03625 [Polaribacter sp.]|nr:hypothetical protein [Polaribacter sp.]
MEEHKENQKLNTFAKKYLKEIELESPSVDFTSKIMGVISDLEITKSTVAYKPLISKKGWFLLATSIIAILLVSVKGVESKWLTFPELNFSFLEKINISGLFDGFSVSNTVLYTACLFAVLIAIQLVYLKGYFEKQLSV